MGGQQADTSLDQWLQAYVEEKGSPPRNALQLVAFAKHRGGLVRYSEALQLCDTVSNGGEDSLLSSRGEMSPRTMAAAAYAVDGCTGFDSEGRGVMAEGRQLTPRDWRLLRFGVSPPADLNLDSAINASGHTEAHSSSEARRDRALSLDQARYRCDSPERQLQPARLRYFWTLPRAKVELLYSRRTGKKQVVVDGKALFKTFQQSFEWSWEDAESQVRIFLRSENGSHELFCEDLNAATPATSPRDPSAMAQEIARRGSSLPLSWREPEGARLGAPRTPRGDRTGVPAAIPVGTRSAARKSSPGELVGRGRYDVSPMERDEAEGQHTPGGVSHVAASKLVEVPVAAVMTPPSQPSRAQACTPRPCDSPRTPVGLGSRAASAPELGFDGCPIYGAATAAASASTAPAAASSASAEAGNLSGSFSHTAMSYTKPTATAAPAVPRLVLPAAECQSADQTGSMTAGAGGSLSGKAGLSPTGATPAGSAQVDANAEGWASPFTVQFRHSRSAPIFAKVKEYLNAARPSPPPRNAASAVVPATFRKHLPTAAAAAKPTNHATRGAPLLGSHGHGPFRDGGSTHAVAAAEVGRNLGRSAGAVLMTTAIAQATRQLASVTPPPAATPQVTTPVGSASVVIAVPTKQDESRPAVRATRVKRSSGPAAVEPVPAPSTRLASMTPPRHLEALPEDSQHHDQGGILKGVNEGLTLPSSLVRTSSAPGKFQRPLGYRVEAEMLDDDLDNIDELDGAICYAAHPDQHSQASQAYARPNPKVSARPSIPRIAMEWSREVERAERESPNGFFKGGAKAGKSGVGADRVLWVPQPKATGQPLPQPPQPSLFMLWTPRKTSSPRHEGHQRRIATPDAASKTTPRPPAAVPTASSSKTSPAGVPSWPLMQPMQARSPVTPPSAPTTTSPTPSRPRQPTPQYSNVFTLGNAQAPCGGSRIIVPRASGHTGTAHVAYAFAVDSSGSRSVGYPPPGERGYKPGQPPSATLPSAVAGYAL